jgi:TonB family protein
MKIITLLFLVLIISGVTSGLGAGQDVIDDKDINVVYFEEMEYPSVARQTRVHGVVVVRVELDEKGNVISSVAISGAKALIPGCLSNAKKWRFQPNAAKTAIIVYEFRFADGTCISGINGQFIFVPPNIATVRSCQRVATP